MESAMNRGSKSCGNPGRSWLAAAWLALAGCGDAPALDNWTTKRDTLPSGVVHVTNAPAAEARPAWTLVEELRVGSREGAGPEAFGYVKGLVALDGGGFVVLDSQAQELRVFGPDGAHIATHGGKGEGPGEFVSANGLMAGPNGRTWVPDTRGGRMSVFDPDEGFVESFPFADASFGWVWNGALVGESRIYRPWAGARRGLRVYDLAMTLVDSLPLPGDRPEDEEFDPGDQPGAFYQETGGGGYMVYSIPFYPNAVRHIASDGAFWSTRNGDPQYRFTRWERGGNATLVVETQRPSVAVPAAERDSVIDEMRQMVADMGVGEWDWSRVPTVMPAVESIFESAEGDLWVRTPSASDGVLFDLYSEDGVHLGTAILESDLDLASQVAPVVRGDQAWMVMTDELDVSYVVRSRMTPLAD